jgi:hypothetical protein
MVRIWPFEKRAILLTSVSNFGIHESFSPAIAGPNVVCQTTLFQTRNVLRNYAIIIQEVLV